MKKPRRITLVPANPPIMVQMGSARSGRSYVVASEKTSLVLDFTGNTSYLIGSPGQGKSHWPAAQTDKQRATKAYHKRVTKRRYTRRATSTAKPQIMQEFEQLAARTTFFTPPNLKEGREIVLPTNRVAIPFPEHLAIKHT
jgi:hypothetical protein